MKIFVVNCGSSSIKYKLLDMADESVLAGGVMERLGGRTQLHHAAGSREFDLEVQAADHTAGMKIILKALADEDMGVVGSIEEIDAVGHRVVHGGDEISRPTIIDEALLDVIRRWSKLAPLHNPPNLSGIAAVTAALPSRPQVAVFDTAFMMTLEPKAYQYAVPEQWRSEHHVRRYGFHGTSHRYVSLRVAELLGCPAEKANLITVHLGNGCSMTAVAGGKAVDHSLGMTPLEGLVMGTRCGDIDPGVVLHMLSEGFSAEQIDEALNKASGLLGLSGVSNDMRDLLRASEAGDAKASLAIETFVYRIVKYIGAYYTILPGVDAVVLTGGIGENSAPVREMICRGLTRLGVDLDVQRNGEAVGGRAGAITTDESALAVWVVPTDEELMIARDTKSLSE